MAEACAISNLHQHRRGAAHGLSPLAQSSARSRRKKTELLPNLSDATTAFRLLLGNVREAGALSGSSSLAAWRRPGELAGGTSRLLVLAGMVRREGRGVERLSHVSSSSWSRRSARTCLAPSCTTAGSWKNLQFTPRSHLPLFCTAGAVDNSSGNPGRKRHTIVARAMGHGPDKPQRDSGTAERGGRRGCER